MRPYPELKGTCLQMCESNCRRRLRWDTPISVELLTTLTGVGAADVGRVVSECQRRSVMSRISDEVTVHALTIAAIEATNQAGALATALDRAESRLYSIVDQSDMGALRSEIAHYQQVLERTGRVLGVESANLLSFANNLAIGYWALGRTAEAVVLFEETLAIRERVLGPEHPETLQSRYELANATKRLRQKPHIIRACIAQVALA